MCGFGLAIFRITSAISPDVHHQSGETQVHASDYSGDLEAPKDFMSPDFSEHALSCGKAGEQPNGFVKNFGALCRLGAVCAKTLTQNLHNPLLLRAHV